LCKVNVMNLKEAIAYAKHYLEDINGEVENPQVEEAVLSPDNKSWSVVLSYFNKIEKPNDLQKTLGITGSKVYKKFVINVSDSSLIGLYNWSYDRKEVA
jgi:hypothetical protein